MNTNVRTAAEYAVVAYVGYQTIVGLVGFTKLAYKTVEDKIYSKK